MLVLRTRGEGVITEMEKHAQRSYLAREWREVVLEPWLQSSCVWAKLSLVYTSVGLWNNSTSLRYRSEMLIDQVYHDVGDIKLFTTTKKKMKVPETPHFSFVLLCWGRWSCSLFTPSETATTVQSVSCSTLTRQSKYLRSFLHKVSHTAIWSSMIQTPMCLNRMSCLTPCLIRTYMTR